MHSAWFRSAFLKVLKFLQIKEEGSNFWAGTILQKIWTIWSPVLHYNFKNFRDANSFSFIRFQCIFYVIFYEKLLSGFWNFCKLEKGNLISGGKIIWIISPPYPLVYLNFKSFKDLNFLSFIRLQWILLDLGVIFSCFGNFYKLKRG